MLFLVQQKMQYRHNNYPELITLHFIFYQIHSHFFSNHDCELNAWYMSNTKTICIRISWNSWIQNTLSFCTIFYGMDTCWYHEAREKISWRSQLTLAHIKGKIAKWMDTIRVQYREHVLSKQGDIHTYKQFLSSFLVPILE